MREENKEREISFLQIRRAVKGRIPVLLGAAIIGAVIFVLVFHFLINPFWARYRLEFTVAYLGSEGEKYPDGSPFYAQDIVSLESLRRVKESDSAFAGTDVERMTEKDAITIEKVQDGENRYALVVRRSYFRSARSATAFLKAAAEVPALIAKEKAESADYFLERTVFENASFSDQIALLSAQKEILLAQYDSWIGALSGTYLVGGKALQTHRTEVAAIFGDSEKRSLLEDLELYGYVPLSELPVRHAELMAEKAVNEAKIQELRELLKTTQGGSYAGGEALASRLADYITRDIDIEREMSALTQENIETFSKRISEQYEGLEKAAKNLQSVLRVLYEQESRTIFHSATASSEGGLNLVVAGILGLLAGFFLSGGIVAYFRLSKEGEPSEEKEEDKEETR